MVETQQQIQNFQVHFEIGVVVIGEFHIHRHRAGIILIQFAINAFRSNEVEERETCDNFIFLATCPSTSFLGERSSLRSGRIVIFPNSTAYPMLSNSV